MPRQIFLSVQKMHCACTSRQSPHIAHQAQMKRESENGIPIPDAIRKDNEVEWVFYSRGGYTLLLQRFHGTFH